MSIFKSSILITTSTLLMSGAALAADPVEYPPLPEEYESNGFDWDGFYAGIGLSISSRSNGGFANGLAYVDAIVGYNYTYNHLLIGAEAWYSGYYDYVVVGTGGGAEVRAGVLVSDDWLLYTGLGYFRFDGGAEYITAGWGTEYAVTDNMSVDVEYKYTRGLNTSFEGPLMSTSMNWHF